MGPPTGKTTTRVPNVARLYKSSIFSLSRRMQRQLLQASAQAKAPRPGAANTRPRLNPAQRRVLCARLMPSIPHSIAKIYPDPAPWPCSWPSLLATSRTQAAEMRCLPTAWPAGVQHSACCDGLALHREPDHKHDNGSTVHLGHRPRAGHAYRRDEVTGIMEGPAPWHRVLGGIIAMAFYSAHPMALIPRQ
jgi:hypothetical protein